MKSEYAKLLKAMSAWYDEIDVPVIQIVYSVDDGEIEIAGYANFPMFRQILAGEIKDAIGYYNRLDEQEPLTVSIVYAGQCEPFAIFMNGSFWASLGEDGIS